MSVAAILSQRGNYCGHCLSPTAERETWALHTAIEIVIQKYRGN